MVGLEFSIKDLKITNQTKNGICTPKKYIVAAFYNSHKCYQVTTKTWATYPISDVFLKKSIKLKLFMQ